jgi:hypothetical protein
MRMSPSQLSRVAAQVATLLALCSVRGAAQATADSAARAKAAADSTVAGYGDSTKQGGVDTSQGKQGADSAAKAPKAPADSATARPPAAAALPTDSVLSGSCASARAGTVAPGILLVLFRDSATEKERASAVTAAGGVVAGSAPGGGDYVRVASDTISSRDLADRLVQDPAVASISERTCPPARP